MSCLRLGLATAIDNPKSGDRTTEVVGAADLAAEGGIPDFAVDQNLLDPTLLLLGRCLQEFASIAVELPIIEIKAGRVGWCQYIIKPAPDDGSEILVGQRADGLALQISSGPWRVGEGAQGCFGISAPDHKWHRPVEWEIAFNISIGMPRSLRVFFDARHAGGSNVGAASGIALGFAVDDP